MKRRLVIFALIPLLLFATGCEEKIDRIQMGDIDNRALKNRDEVHYISLGAFDVFLVDGLFHVISYNDDWVVNKNVEFNKEREYMNAEGIEPVTVSDLDSYIGRSESVVLEELGTPHGWADNAIYMPCYVTQDAYFIYFYSEQGRIKGAVKFDIITKRETIAGDLW